MTRLIPSPLRILLVWPEPAAGALWRGLQSLRPQVDITLISATSVTDYLQEAGYYHILHVTPAYWRSLSPRQQAVFSSRVRMVILGPGQASASDLGGAASGLFMPGALPDAEVTTFYLAFHRRLAAGEEIASIVASSGDKLAMVGSAPSFAPEQSKNDPPPAAGYQVNQAVANNSGIVVGSIVVEGDMVSGDKVVYHTEGDQVNINRRTAGAAKLTQSAGGDQVNVNRTAGASLITTCPQCSRPVHPGNRFCMSCGVPLDKIT
ncbi:MAG: zinc ribbon domain-containing protein [Anaerolineae bacterium]|nr:zinc ribbon domain-containing protein [Anaerolineae bacterium]